MLSYNNKKGNNMTKDNKELQRYLVKWILMFLLISIVGTGIYGFLNKFTDYNIIVIMLAEIATLLGIFFGFNMTTSVSEDKMNIED